MGYRAIVSDLSRLEKEIRDRITRSRERNESRQRSLRDEMDETERRRGLFEAAARRLVAHVLEPRMGQLRSCFPNAEDVPMSSYWRTLLFRPTIEYPAEVRFGLGIAHDEGVSSLIVRYEVEVLPVFSRLEKSDHASFPVDADDENAIAGWIDAKVVEFVDLYLGIQDADEYHRGLVVTDPVCGMVFRRSIATAEESHAGETYWFCSPTCAEEFSADPEKFLGAGGSSGNA